MFSLKIADNFDLSYLVIIAYKLDQIYNIQFKN